MSNEERVEVQSMGKREQNKFELEQLILRCLVMRFSESEAIAYIKSNGKDIESTRYYEIKKDLMHTYHA